jgi:dihydroorotase
MDANDYFKRGKEYLEKENYSQAIADFWKVMEMINDPDKVEKFREKTKKFDPDVVAMHLMITLQQILG